MLISLWFIKDTTGVSLYRSKVEPGNGYAPLVSQRGTTPNGSIGGFHWSSGVQAVMLLLLDYRLHGAEAVIEGEGGTPASSFDYSLSKKPIWLLDMFGVDQSGESLLRSMLTRSNPERKRPGPVSIRINPQMLRPNEIQVYLDGRALDDDATIATLYQAINSKTPGTKAPLTVTRSKIESPTPPTPASEIDRLCDVYVTSIREQLFRTEIFNRTRYKQCVNELMSCPSLTPHFGTQRKQLSPFDLEVSGSLRLGIHNLERTRRAFEPLARPLRIAASWSIPQIIVLVRHWQRSSGIPMEVDSHFLHSVELSESLINGLTSELPDLCFLAPGSAANLLKSKRKIGLRPLMLAPSTNMALLRRASKQKVPSDPLTGSFHYMSDVPSTGSFFFNDMISDRAISSRKTKSFHHEPDEVAEALRAEDRDIHGILWFPYTYLNCRYNQCEQVVDSGDHSGWSHSIILASEELLSNRPISEALIAGLRDSWWKLRSDEHTLQKEVLDLFNEPRYFERLFRSAGVSPENFPIAAR